MWNSAARARADHPAAQSSPRRARSSSLTRRSAGMWTIPPVSEREAVTPGVTMLAGLKRRRPVPLPRGRGGLGALFPAGELAVGPLELCRRGLAGEMPVPDKRTREATEQGPASRCAQELDGPDVEPARERVRLAFGERKTADLLTHSVLVAR